MDKERKEVAPGVFADEETARGLKIDGNKAKYPKERFGWLKNKLRGWLFPEYDKVCLFMIKVKQAKEEVVIEGGKVTFKEPVILIGSVLNSKVDIKPTLKTEIILSKLELEAALRIYGDHHIVSQNQFANFPSALKLSR